MCRKRDEGPELCSIGGTYILQTQALNMFFFWIISMIMSLVNIFLLTCLHSARDGSSFAFDAKLMPVLLTLRLE